MEDEEALRTLATKTLVGLGYRVLAAGTAEEAVDVSAEIEGPIDLLLSDVVLPGDMQGSDLAQSLLASRPDLRVLCMSGYARNAIVHAGRLDEGVEFLDKPFTPVILAAAVRRVLDRGRTSG